MSIFLGISSLDCDSAVTFVKDGKIWFAAQEERFTRVKQQDGFPYHAIEAGLKHLGVTIDEIEAIGYGWFTPEEERELYLESGKKAKTDFKKYGGSRASHLSNILNLQRRGRIVNFKEWTKYEKQLKEGLKRIGYSKELKRYHHQLCHIASTYYTGGFDDALVLSLDGYGSGCAGSLYVGEGGKLKQIESFLSPQSLGAMYSKVTKALGFIPNRHEGKILGLAAYGNPDKYFDEVMKDFRLEDCTYTYLNPLDQSKYTKIFKEGAREDLAAAFQKVLETVVVHLVKGGLKKFGLSKVCLSGGVAANVKMNQRVMEIPACEEIFVHPGMSDCGIGTGAALLMANEESPIKPFKLDDVYLGPQYSEDDILKALGKFSFKYQKEENIEKKMAELLNEGSVIGFFQGRMEYGPRALCNRTILAPTQDDGINKWLNKRLNRTEFMPFAPVTVDHQAKNMYANMDKIDYTSQFMTITTDCSAEMKKSSPAAVHVDGTARPQIVTKENNLRMHKVLNHYFELSGVPNLVNTSYNMHEEPIVCTPYDAVKAFSDGRLDYLVLEDYLVLQSDSEE